MSPSCTFVCVCAQTLAIKHKDDPALAGMTPHRATTLNFLKHCISNGKDAVEGSSAFNVLKIPGRDGTTMWFWRPNVDQARLEWWDSPEYTHQRAARREQYGTKGNTQKWGGDGAPDAWSQSKKNNSPEWNDWRKSSWHGKSTGSGSYGR